MNKPLIIGITGGSGSGKSYFVRQLISRFKSDEVCLVTQDNYYKSREEQPVDANGIRNFDLPESIDGEKLYQDLLLLRNGQTVELLEYTFNNPDIAPKKLIFQPAPVLIVEGLMIFCWETIRKIIDYSIFIDAEDLIKIKRRIIRDSKERGYDLEDVLYRYQYHVTPFFNTHLAPLKKEVDVIVPNNADVDRAVEILEGFIRYKTRL